MKRDILGKLAKTKCAVNHVKTERIGMEEILSHHSVMHKLSQFVDFIM